MNSSAESDIATWESEGGASTVPPRVSAISSGTINQIEWAIRIKRHVNTEFDRVARSFRSVAGKQDEVKRSDTEAIIAILEEKRAEVMRREDAGYFIHDWQEISDQVRQMIFADTRYQAIRERTRARRYIMNIRPLSDHIVVKRIEERETTRNGIVIPDSVNEQTQEGEVLAAGHGRRREDGAVAPLEVRVGDRVLYGKYSGVETQVSGAGYIIMREDDVLAVLDPAPEPARKVT